MKDALNIVKVAGFDLIILETSGIGQSDTEIVEHSDLSLYVMTPEYGASTQLEKIDMLDFADIVVLHSTANSIPNRIFCVFVSDRWIQKFRKNPRRIFT